MSRKKFENPEKDSLFSDFFNMPFWKKEKKNGSQEDSNGSADKPKEKVNYKARLEHKQYLVRRKIKKKIKRKFCGV